MRTLWEKVNLYSNKLPGNYLEIIEPKEFAENRKIELLKELNEKELYTKDISIYYNMPRPSGTELVECYSNNATGESIILTRVKYTKEELKEKGIEI